MTRSSSAKSFVQAYSGRQWIDKERARLTTAITAAIEGSEQ